MSERDFNRLAQLVDQLRGCDDITMCDAIINEVIETGGYCGSPRNWPSAPHGMIEIDCHGVSAWGSSFSRACADWLTSAAFGRSTEQLVSPARKGSIQ